MLKLIDFSDGIRADEIQSNFNTLQEQINRERKNVGGSGIASGLEITTIVNLAQNEFAIELSEASIISKNGEEIHIPKQKIDIELPKLAKEVEYLTSKDSILDKMITMFGSYGEMDIPLGDLVDFEKEKARLEAELNTVKKEIERGEKLLSNQNYVSKAPEAIVNKEREDLQKEKDRLAILNK